MSASPLLERPRLGATDGSPKEHVALLYERYSQRIFGYCLYKLGNRQEAEDAAQTTFLWAFRGLEQGIEPRMEANWLFTIAQNACRARIRTRGRRREQEVLSDPQILEEVAPGRAGSGDDLVGLTDALRDMPELQRQAIILREWRGFSYKEIAAELELSDAAVETLIFRARRSLASRLENPNARPAKRAQAFALNLGSLGSAFKSLLGLGTAAKVGAVAATVAALGIGVALPGDTPARATKSSPPASASVPELARVGLPAAPAATHVKARRHQGHGTPAAPAGSADSTSHQTPAGEPPTAPVPLDPAASQLGPVTHALAPATDIVDSALVPATDIVDSTLSEVDQVVAAANAALEPVLPVPSPLP